MHGNSKRIRGLFGWIIILPLFFASSCIFGGKEYKINCVRTAVAPCFVEKGEDPCLKCPHIHCKGGQR